MNMAESAWIGVECEKQLFSTILCYFEEQIDVMENTIIVDEKIFDQSCVIKNQICYLFKWIEVKPSDIIKIGTNINIIKLFEYLFHAISVAFPPIILPDFRQRLMYSKYGNILRYDWQPIDDSRVEGTYITRDFSRLFQVGGNLSECGDNIYISIKFVCDGQIDCGLNRTNDELGCLCSSNTSYSPKCVHFVDGHRKKCSFYYWKIETNVCKQYHNLKTLFKSKENEDKSPHIIYPPKKIHDCQKKVCKSQIACGKSDAHSYDISKFCTYHLDPHNELIPCKSGGHLENCTHFECNMKFKCPGYYCIPWKYICDGKWDCPHGIDESQEHNCMKERKCTNMFKCKNSIICIHIGNICNKKTDCPRGDDEYLCDLKFTTCPRNCSCLTFAIKCVSVDQLRVDSSNNLPYHVIHIEECSEVFTKEFLQFLDSITLFTMNGLFFDDICAVVSNLQHSIIIDVSYNRVKRIQNDCFQQHHT